jgi:hypothetical protein
MEKKSPIYFVCEKYPEDDFALELDPKKFAQEEADHLFLEKLAELPKLRLKLKDYLEYHIKLFSGNKIEFLEHLEHITSKVANENLSDWISQGKEEIGKSVTASDFQKNVVFSEVPVKWADDEKEITTWVAKMIKEGYFTVKDPKSAEQFFETLFR